MLLELNLVLGKFSYLIISSESTNIAGNATNSIQTTVTVESDGGVAGNPNKASGTDSGITKQ